MSSCFSLFSLILIPPLLFQPNPASRAVITFGAMLMYYIKNKRINIIPSLIIFTAVTLASVLRPSGEVIFYIYKFPVTRDSLISGASRALLLTGLVYISRFSVSASLPFPGKAGKLLGNVFFFLNRITRFKWRNYIKKGNSVSPISSFTAFFDEMLFMSDSEEEPDSGNELVDRERTSMLLVIVMSLIIIVGYTLPILYFLKYL